VGGISSKLVMHEGGKMSATVICHCHWDSLLSVLSVFSAVSSHCLYHITLATKSSDLKVVR